MRYRKETIFLAISVTKQAFCWVFAVFSRMPQVGMRSIFHSLKSFRGGLKATIEGAGWNFDGRCLCRALR